MGRSNNILSQRRQQLGISYPELSRLCGVSMPTTRRIVEGDGIDNASYRNVRAVTQALGFDLQLAETVSAQDLCEQKATQKARKLVGMVQGTSALEAQAVDTTTHDDMVRQTVHELMAGSRRRLWTS